MDENIKEVRVQILKRIIEHYKVKKQDEEILSQIADEKNIAELLKLDALLYSFMQNSYGHNTLGHLKNYVDFHEDITYLYESYLLYFEYARYFLGASIIYPSLEWKADPKFREYSLCVGEKVNYQQLLHEIFSNDAPTRS